MNLLLINYLNIKRYCLMWRKQERPCVSLYLCVIEYSYSICICFILHVKNLSSLNPCRRPAVRQLC